MLLALLQLSLNMVEKIQDRNDAAIVEMRLEVLQVLKYQSLTVGPTEICPPD